MGGITSVLTAFPAVIGGAQAINARKNDKSDNALAQRQLEQQQKLQEEQAGAKAVLEKEQITLSTAQSEEARKAALKRAVARQRASFGSQGVGSGAGSSQALLLGMFEESDAEREKREAMDTLRLRVIDEDTTQRAAKNVLQRTQLLERNRLDSISRGLNTASDVVKFGGKLF